MSLIYDYLKIDGKGGPQRDADVEIPPALKRRETSRFNPRLLPVILGSCFVGALLIFIMISIFNPGRDLPITANIDTKPAVPVQATQEQSAETKTVLREAAPILQAEGNPAVPKSTIQVFPEPGKPAPAETTAAVREELSPGEQAADIRKKLVPPLELQSIDRKITFPDQAPVYSEPQESAGSMAAVGPGSVGQNRPSASRPSAAPRQDSAAMVQGGKFYQAGLQAQRKGDSRTAEIYYDKTLEAMPGHLDAMINLSAIYVQQERYLEAEDILADILAIEPANSKALVNLGMVSLNRGNDGLAAARFEQAVAANPLEENGLVNLAYLAEKNRDYAATERYYRQLLQISPDNIEVLLAYGHLLEGQGRYSEAVSLYGDTRKLDAVKKDQQLYSRISDRMRLLAGVIGK